MDLRLAVHARAKQALAGVLAVLVAATPALGAPKHKNAKAAFEKGVKAYQEEDFELAADKLGESYDLEPDLETLYAWAQAERKLDDCEKASELYRKLLGYSMPEENKQAVRDKLEECRQILKERDPEEYSEVEQPTHERETGKIQVVTRVAPPAPWWKDTLGDALLGGGVVALAVGASFMVSASDADTKAKENYDDFAAQNDLAKSRGVLGTVFLVGSGVLVTGAIIHYVAHGHSEERRYRKQKTDDTTVFVTPTGIGLRASF